MPNIKLLGCASAYDHQHYQSKTEEIVIHGTADWFDHGAAEVV